MSDKMYTYQVKVDIVNVNGRRSFLYYGFVDFTS